MRSSADSSNRNGRPLAGRAQGAGRQVLRASETIGRKGVRPVGFAGKLLWNAVRQFVNDRSLIYAGYIAYTGLFALFPFLIFLTALGGVLGQGEAAEQFITYMLDAMPAEVASTLEPTIRQITGRSRAGLMTLSIAITLWVASSGLEALRAALNEAYNVEETRPIWSARLQSLLLTILLSGGVLLAMGAIVAGPFIWSFLEWLLIVPAFYGWLYGISRYVFGVVVLYAIVILLYYALPGRALRWREVLPGATLAVVLWIVSASLFSLYLESLVTYSLTYGSLAGIVVTLLFFYVSACIFIFGAQINAAIRRRDAARRAHAVSVRAGRMTAAMAERATSD